MIKNRPNDYVTSAEAAEMIGVTPDHIRHLIVQGKIKAEKLGTVWVIKRNHLKKIKRKRFPREKEETTDEHRINQ